MIAVPTLGGDDDMTGVTASFSSSSNRTLRMDGDRGTGDSIGELRPLFACAFVFAVGVMEASHDSERAHEAAESSSCSVAVEVEECEEEVADDMEVGIVLECKKRPTRTVGRGEGRERGKGKGEGAEKGKFTRGFTCPVPIDYFDFLSSRGWDISWHRPGAPCHHGKHKHKGKGKGGTDTTAWTREVFRSTKLRYIVRSQQGGGGGVVQPTTH